MSNALSKVKLPYLLLLPGFLFLFTFFILPIVNLAQTSTQTPIAGGDTGQNEQTLRFSNYVDAFTENQEQFARSFIFALCATVLALAIAYPLAYAIAFKAGRLKNFLLVLVVAPFFCFIFAKNSSLEADSWRRRFCCSNPSHNWTD